MSNIIYERRYLLYSALSTTGIAFFSPIIYVFLLNNSFTYGKIGIYLSFFWGVASISEIPFGMFADKYGQKKSLLVSYFSRVLGLLFLLSNNFVMLLVSAFFSGIAEAANSGTLASWMINQAPDRENLKIENIFSRTSAISSICSLIIGFISGNFIFKFSSVLPILLSITIFSILTILTVIDLPEIKIEHKNSLDISKLKSLEIKSSMNKFFEFTKNYRKILIIIFILIIPSILDIGPSNQWQVAFHVLENNLGYLWVLIMSTGIITNMIMSRINVNNKFKTLYEIYFFIILDIIIIIAINQLKWQVPLFLVHVSLFTILSLKKTTYLHKNIVKNDSLRSTTVSIFYTIEGVIVTLLLSLNGFISEVQSVLHVWQLFALFSLVIFSLLLCALRFVD